MNRIRIAAAASALAFIGLVAAAPAALAVSYPPSGTITWVNDSDGTLVSTPGGLTDFSTTEGSFNPVGPVNVLLTGENANGASLATLGFAVYTDVNLGTTSPNLEGAVSGQIHMPSNASGVYTLTLQQGDTTLSAQITVVSGMATTGVNAQSMNIALWGSIALIALGGATFAIVAVRRKSAKSE